MPRGTALTAWVRTKQDMGSYEGEHHTRSHDRGGRNGAACELPGAGIPATPARSSPSITVYAVPSWMRMRAAPKLMHITPPPWSPTGTPGVFGLLMFVGLAPFSVLRHAVLPSAWWMPNALHP